MNFKQYIRTGALALIATAVVSCSQNSMDDVNFDKNHPQNVLSRFILTDAIVATAFSNVGGDINTYTSAYNEQETGVYNQLYNAEHRINEPSRSSTFNNVWGSLYSVLKNTRIVIDKCSPGGSEEGNYVTRGVAEVLAALNSGIIADMFGDAPWSQAALIDAGGLPVYMNPKIDKQADIYAGLMQYLDSAIIDLTRTDKWTTIGTNDLLYKGSKSSWLKLAYGLKARYLMHTLHVSTDKENLLHEILVCLDKSFRSSAEEAAFNIYNASNLNPTFDFQWSRDALGVSESMIKKLEVRNDPRLRRVLVDPYYRVLLSGTADKLFYPAPNGKPEQVQGEYTYSVYMYAQTASTMLMSYHEVLFLKAEALCRLGRGKEAATEAILKAAVMAAIENTEKSVSAAMKAPTVAANGGGISGQDRDNIITSTEAALFFDKEIRPLFIINPLKETMMQKYIAFWGASGESTETYNDIRRMRALGEDFITLENPNNATMYPLRLPYGNDDTTTNPAVQAAYGDGQYVYSVPVWWAGGSR